MPIETILNARVPVKIWTDRVEPQAMAQLKNTAALPFVFRHVAAMPDVHLGKGATVGSVIATKGAICPAAVGVDIGCGMAARKTSFPADGLTAAELRKLRASIEREIPVGRESKRQPFEAASSWMRKRGRPNASRDDGTLADRALHQLGTLGGGNHFIEICVDADDGMLWVLLHSGSRNVGKTVAERHIGRAKGAMKLLSESLPDPDLAYFLAGTREFEDSRRTAKS
jgi:tRNA-splicing ligase RtcB